MAHAPMNLVLRHLRRIMARQNTGSLSDGQLVERFLQHREEAAFTELVRRHGPMVLNVSRSILHHAQDAEDVFQATFLILARKAEAIHRQEAVGCWLYRVAHRLAVQAVADSAQRRVLEAKSPDGVTSDPLLDMTVRELHQALHEELERLPEKYRAPLVLCYLEGRTQDEAARQLGWSPGALRGRLNRGREQLRVRLTRRGLALSAGLLTLGLTPASAAVPQALAEATVRAGLLFRIGQASGAVSVNAVTLAEGGLRTLFLGKLKSGVVVLLVASLLTATAGVLLLLW